MKDISPEQEAERLEVLRQLAILDTPPEGAFDRVTALAAAFFHVPVAIVSLVDEDRIWFKSHHGLDLSQIARSPGLCDDVIRADDVYVVKNAIEDPRTRAHPLVAGEPGLRFYAGAPLISQSGHRIGTFNIIDFVPRELDAGGETALRYFAGIVMDQMELRLTARETIASFDRLLKTHAHSLSPSGLVTVCAWTKQIKINREWLSIDEFLTKKLGMSVSHGMHPEVVRELGDEPGPGGQT